MLNFITEAVAEEAVAFRHHCLLDDHPVRAKKEYRCHGCRGIIFATQRHRRVVYKDNDGFHCDRVHERCYV